MMKEDAEAPPFWLQSSNNLRRRRPSSAILNSGVLLILLLLTAILFLFLIIPKILSLAPQIFRPSSVKKGWDSLNLLLVLFAIVCGFLSRNKDEGGETPVSDRSVSSSSSSNVLSRRRPERSNSSTPRNWYEYPDRKLYNSSTGTSDATTTTGGFMRRNSSSYPDLRQGFIDGEDRWRFFDDTEVNEYRVRGSDHLRRRRQPREELDGDFSKIKTTLFVEDLPAAPLSRPPPSSTRSFEAVAAEEEKVEVSASAESEVGNTQTPPLSSPPPPTPPPPVMPSALKIRRRARRSSESLARKQNAENPASNVRNLEAQSSPPLITSEQKRRRDDRKRIGSSSSTKEFLTSLYHQRKRKKKHRHKSLDNFDTILDLSTISSSSSSAQLHSPPRSLPPPPLFKNLFSSGRGKTKRSHSVSPPLTSTARRALETKEQIALEQSHPGTIAAYKPVFAVKTRIPDTSDENVSSGAQSPRIPIPPPPPPPPFRIPEWKFAVQGDFVRLLSDLSSRSVSPEPDQMEPSPTAESGRAAAVAGDATTGMFCPSPDVDTKADSFIARFRAGLKLEKINSIKEKQGLGLSGLGPGPRSGP